jgi:neutral ceramidase
METLSVGSARVEITPTTPAALSGFIARRNQPFTRVDDPIYVRALVLEDDGQRYILLNYELLGFDAAVRDTLLAALEEQALPGFARERCVITTTHTHSGPAVSPIEGETGAGPGYITFLCQRTLQAVQEALRQARPATLRVAAQAIDGLTYNRRALLADGRVSIAYDPDQAVVERGPLDNTLTLLVWSETTAPDRALAALVNFACHGVALLTQAVSGDLPGQIMQQMEEKFGAPCLFLQGPAGDVNPTTVAGERPAMLAWAGRFRQQVAGIEDRLQPAAAGPLRSAAAVLPLGFRPLPERAEVERNIRVLEQVAAGDFSSLQAAETAGALANLLNIRPGDQPDPEQAAFTAQALAHAERRVLRAVQAGGPLAPCPLEIAAWRLGDVLLVFTGAEMFSHTGLRLRAMGQGCRVLPVAYAAPVVGYIPDADSMRKGGYEANDAWRFYGQPGPFEFDAETRLLETAQALVDPLQNGPMA